MITVSCFSKENKNRVTKQSYRYDAQTNPTSACNNDIVRNNLSKQSDPACTVVK